MNRPNSYEEFLRLTKLDPAKYTKCVNCSEPFSDKNVKTPGGWRETQISGLCEDCFDYITDLDDEYMT
jgi:uncharacterized protein YbdZ (MbtH family)